MTARLRDCKRLLLMILFTLLCGLSYLCWTALLRRSRRMPCHSKGWSHVSAPSNGMGRQASCYRRMIRLTSCPSANGLVRPMQCHDIRPMFLHSLVCVMVTRPCLYYKTKHIR